MPKETPKDPMKPAKPHDKNPPIEAAKASAAKSESARSEQSRRENLLANTANMRIKGHALGNNRGSQARRGGKRGG